MTQQTLYRTLGVLVVLCTTWSPILGQSRPPNFSPDAIPDTSFSCEDKITGGYYADLEADCQLFHVCVQVSEFEFQDFRFLCPNDTVFDQQNLVCTNWFEVDCKQSIHFFAQEIGLKEPSSPKVKNLQDSKNALFGNNNNNNFGSSNNNDNANSEEYNEYEYESDYDGQGPSQGDDNKNKDGERFLGNSPPAPNSGNRGVGGRERGQGFQGAGVKEDEDVGVGQPPPRRGPPRPTKTTTAIPIDVTTISATTRRPPRVKSNILLAGKQNSGGGRSKNKVGNRVQPTTTTTPSSFIDDETVPLNEAPPITQEIFDNDSITDDRSTDPFRNPPVLSADGKKPRVKSNLKASKSLVGQGGNGVGQDPDKGRHKVEVATDNIEFVPPSLEELQPPEGSADNAPVLGPEVRPDGRPPRVKSNLQNPANKFNGAKDQRVPVPTETAILFDTDTESPLVPLDFVPPPDVATEAGVTLNEDQPFNSIPKDKDDKKTVDLFKRPPTAFANNNKRPEGPRVKSNILANQRNRGGSVGNARGRPKITVPVSNEDPRTTGERVIPSNNVNTNKNNKDFAVATSIPPSVQNFLAQVPTVPLEDSVIQPQFIDEIDEFEQPEIEPSTSAPLPPPVTGHQPRVKSNILASRNNNKKNNNRNQAVTRKPPASSFSSEVGSAEQVFSDVSDDGSCNNPFHCPPSRVADGRKPRVKSNIKAVTRNFFVPDRKTNRIKGKVKPDRGAFNQFLTNLKGRKGKESRQRIKPGQGSAAPQNEIEEGLLDELVEDVQQPTTTTENLLQVLLNQINEEKTLNGDFEEHVSSFAPLSSPPPLIQDEDYEEEISSAASVSTRAPFKHSQKRPIPNNQQFDDNFSAPALSTHLPFNKNQKKPFIPTSTTEQPDLNQVEQFHTFEEQQVTEAEEVFSAPALSTLEPTTKKQKKIFIPTTTEQTDLNQVEQFHTFEDLSAATESPNVDQEDEDLPEEEVSHAPVSSTLSPKEIRFNKQQERIQQFLAQKQQNRKDQIEQHQAQQNIGAFPSFPKVVSGDIPEEPIEPQIEQEDGTSLRTRFPPLLRPTPATLIVSTAASVVEPNEEDETDATTFPTVPPVSITTILLPTARPKQTTVFGTSPRAPKRFGDDGRSPRVKSNIIANNWRKQNKFGQSTKAGFGATPKSKPVSTTTEFFEAELEHVVTTAPSFYEETNEAIPISETTTPSSIQASLAPEFEETEPISPSGPRVKSNLIANNWNRKQQNKFGQSTKAAFAPTPKPKPISTTAEIVAAELEHVATTAPSFSEETNEAIPISETTTPGSIQASLAPEFEETEPISPSGPRVKSNLIANNWNRKQNKFGQSTRSSFGPTPRSKPLSTTAFAEVEEPEPIITTAPTVIEETNEGLPVAETTTPAAAVIDDQEPESVSPSGTRVKSNLAAANNWNRKQQKNKFGQGTRPAFGPTPRSKQVSTTEQVLTTTPSETGNESAVTTAPTPAELEEEKVETETGVTKEPFGKGGVAQLKPDGRSPRVKSNIKALLSFKGRTSAFKSKVPILREHSDKDEAADQDAGEEEDHPRGAKTREGAGRAINLDLESFDNEVAIENKDDDQPVVRPDGQTPRVKSNLLARLQNNQGDSDHTPKSTGRNFRHSTKVGTRRPSFTLSTSGGITFNDENSTTTAFEPTPTPSDETVLTTTPKVNTAAATESSILSDFFSTQVLNTRAVDPELDSLHLSTFDLSRNITVRSISSTSTTPTTTSLKTTRTTQTTSTASTTTTTTTTTREPSTTTTTTAISDNETTTTTTPSTS